MEEVVNKERPLVSIWCTVYNHAPYIRQCLDGFVMQKTNFKFEAVVHDDASTDGSAAIIREYAEKFPGIIKPIIEEENQYSKGDDILYQIRIKTCTGKYIAICEGDDYWTDPLKLQKQVDILESNPNITMVHTAFHDVDANSNSIFVSGRDDYKEKSQHGNAFVNLIDGNYIKTLTTIFRREVITECEILNRCPYKFDYALFLTAASLGDIAYIPEQTGCYRIINTGMMHTMGDKVYEWTVKDRLYFIRCMLNGKVKGLTRGDCNQVAMYVWNEVLSKHPVRSYVLFVLHNLKIVRYLPYAIRERFKAIQN